MTDDQLNLLHRYLDGVISEDEMAELEDLLRREPEARKALRSLATIDAKWQEIAAEQPFSGEVEVVPDDTREFRVVPLWVMLSGMAAALAFGLFGWIAQPDPVIPPTLERGLARVIRVDGNGMANGKALTAGDELHSGDKLSLTEGMLELAFRESGVHMIATGPLDATLDTNKHMYLRTGTAKLVVPPQGHGFVVDTHERKITDLGTSFVVSANEHGSDILVLDGLINVDDREAQSTQYMYEGDVGSFSRDGQAELRSLASWIPELPLSDTPITEQSLQGTLIGIEDVPTLPKNSRNRDLIGPHVMPLVASGFRDDSCLKGLRVSQPIRFAGISGSYNTFVERNGVQPFALKRGWLAWYRGTVKPPQPGRYRFWGYADNHLVVGIDGKVVFEGGRYDSSFREAQLVPRSNHPSYPCLIAEAGFAAGPWIELDGSPLELNLLFGEVASALTSGLLLIEREGETYEETTWGQPKWPLFLTEEPTGSELTELFKLDAHLEAKLRGSFSISEDAVWRVVPE